MNRILMCLLTGLLLSAPVVEAAAQRGNSKNTVDAPTGIAISYTETSLTITWAAASGAARYGVLRRQGTVQEQLGQVSTPSFTGPLPTRGVAYEYQIVSIGRIAQAASDWIAYTVPGIAVVLMPPPAGTGTIITEPRPRGTPTIVLAGPASLSAVSTIPGQIKLSWPSVPNASGYRVTRSSDQPSAEADLIHLAPTTSYTNAPVEFGRTFTYKVYALFGTGTSTVVSTPSPAASTASIAIGQPVELRLYRVDPAPTAGFVNATYTWNAGALAGVEKFIVWLGTGQVLGYPTTITFLHANVAAGQAYTVCVAAIYPFGIRDEKAAKCTPIKIESGPSQLVASSPIPGEIHLSWTPVTGASGYRVLRSSSGGGGDQNVSEIAAATPRINGSYVIVDGPIDFRWTYTYKVHAIFGTPAGVILSGSSPWANAASVPFVQVSGLTYRVAPSTARLGTLDVTLDWTPATGASYAIFAADGHLIGETGTPPFVYRSVPPKYTYNVCVAAVYRYNVRQDKTAPCVEIKL